MFFETKNFDDMGLKDTTLRGIYAYGFEKPSNIQMKAIVPICKGMLKQKFKVKKQKKKT